jgi:hypothetical protein
MDGEQDQRLVNRIFQLQIHVLHSSTCLTCKVSNLCNFSDTFGGILPSSGLLFASTALSDELSSPFFLGNVPTKDRERVVLMVLLSACVCLDPCHLREGFPHQILPNDSSPLSERGVDHGQGLLHQKQHWRSAMVKTLNRRIVR